MTPPAFLALWNGVTPGREAEYEAWHSQEHAPERLGAPGFRALHRYRAERGADYFTLYELDGPEALETPEYQTLVREPTPWSAAMRQVLTGFRRLPCRTLAARRFGQGGAAATLRLDEAAAEALPALRGVAGRAMEEGRLLGILAGAAVRAGQPYAAFPQAPPPASERLLILEATEAGGLAKVLRECRAALGGSPGEIGRWRLLQQMDRAALPDPARRRQAPREDLRRRWSAS